MWYMHGAGWGWWIFMSVGMVAFWAGVIYLLVWLVRGAPHARAQDPTETSAEAPLDILQRRLAAGEISVDEYNERRRALEREPHEQGSPVATEVLGQRERTDPVLPGESTARR